MAVLWGDPDKGPHGTFTKFAPGYDAGMHTHTSDVWLVVIKGAYLYKDDEGEKRVGPGEFLRIPGGHRALERRRQDGRHAFFYQEGSGEVRPDTSEVEVVSTQPSWAGHRSKRSRVDGSQGSPCDPQ